MALLSPGVIGQRVVLEPMARVAKRNSIFTDSVLLVRLAVFEKSRHRVIVWRLVAQVLDYAESMKIQRTEMGRRFGDIQQLTDHSYRQYSASEA